MLTIVNATTYKSSKQAIGFIVDSVIPILVYDAIIDRQCDP